MKHSLIIASALAAVLSTQARAESAGATADQPIDEKCYGVSINEVSVCGTDASSCAYVTPSQQRAANGADPRSYQTPAGEPWAYVPKGTCAKIYGGSLTPRKTS